MQDLQEKLKQIEINYSGKDFWGIVNQIKKERINDDASLELVETISKRKFKERTSFMLSVPAGNLLATVVTVVTIALAFQASDTWMLYISAFILMTALHPLSHYLIGAIFGIRFTHYYLNGTAKIEPTLRIDYSSYLKASGKRRALMHASGVMGTLAAPLISMSAKYR